MAKVLFRCCLSILFLTACTAPAPEYETLKFAAEVCPDGEVVFGIDVSKWQGTIDWQKVAADGVIYAFIRVSDGLNYPDKRFRENWLNAKKYGVIRGVYQFFRPSQDPKKQADYMLAQLAAVDPLTDDDLPPVIDVEATDESTPEEIVAAVRKWIEIVETATGRRPIIYSGRYFWNDEVKSTEFNDYPLWIPMYRTSCFNDPKCCPNIPSAWKDWTFFQYSSKGSIDGINGNVDMNRFNGNTSQLQGFIKDSRLNCVDCQSVCGDGICSLDEANTCAKDCPICAEIPPVGRTIDETDYCFEEGGDPKFWRRVDEGYDGALIWTKTTDKEQEANFAAWHFDFTVAGQYKIEAFIHKDWGQSTLATYLVKHDGKIDKVIVDQSKADGWLELGTFTFSAGGNQWVRMSDNTGEPNSSNKQLVADALRVTNLNPPTPDVTDGDITSDGDIDVPDTGDTNVAIGSEGDSTPNVPETTPIGEENAKANQSGSCSALGNQGAPGGAMWLVLMVLAGLVWRRPVNWLAGSGSQKGTN